MNKEDKLRLYGQKDYTELIEFPVELVGKDGVVRRYTYEESLLVYAKRIESAHLRYRDPDIADAEVDHCYKRIEQIKRSWRHVSSRKVTSNADYAARYEETAAAECRAFIREYFGKILADRVAADDEPIPIYLSLVSHTGPLKVFHVSLANRKGNHLLYAFTFAWEPEKDGDPNARAQFADWTRILAATPVLGDDVERLLAAREGKEFGFLLTGPLAAAVPSVLPEVDEPSVGLDALAPARPPRTGAARARVQALIEEDPGNAEAHYAMGKISTDEGDIETALDEYKKCVDLQPWYRDAYRRIAILGDSLQVFDEVEAYLLQARHYFPEDDRLQFHIGLNCIRQGRYPEAKDALGNALGIEPANRRARWLLDLLERSLRRGEDPRAALASWKPTDAERIAARPTKLALGLVLAVIAIGAVVHALSVASLLADEQPLVDPMAGTFLLAVPLLVALVSAARGEAAAIRAAAPEPDAAPDDDPGPVE